MGGLQGALNDYKCGASRAASAWLRHPEVQKALHVDPSMGDHTFNYDSTEKDLRPMYPKFVEKYRVMIYSGDVDACVPYSGTEMWTSNLGFHVSDAWRPWTLDGSRMAGYVTVSWESVTSFFFPKHCQSLCCLVVIVVVLQEYLYGQFLYVTVRGAGHMVPQHKPEAALAMFTNFITQSTFEPYGHEGPSSNTARPEHVEFVSAQIATDSPSSSPEPTPAPAPMPSQKASDMVRRFIHSF